MPLYRRKQVVPAGAYIRARRPDRPSPYRWMASCPLFCRSLRRIPMYSVSLTYPYPLHTFPLIGAPLHRRHRDYRYLETTCTIPVSGMHCAGCSGRVQQALESTPGVSAANVNLMTNSATVDFDPSAVTPERAGRGNRETGYGAELPTEGTSTTS